MGLEIIRLNLVSPLYYVRDEGADPFSYREGKGEMVFHFELEPNQCRSIEPDEGALLGALIAGGRAADKAASPEAALVLPGGNYLFSQVREILSRRDIAGLAAEVQKEGLWQRLRPGKELYLRYLFEDGLGVTQVFRPYTEAINAGLLP
ncbi:MAG: hypothetical protein LBQ67_04280 [Treponema sp.]|jgi:hypothetical protein|nr:hypothetical protein [Treponema sp.]